MGLEEHTERQSGLVTSDQLRSSGVTARTASYWASTGKLVREAKGLYRVPGTPRSREAMLLAAQMGSSGVLSHRSAAHIWQLSGIKAVRPELIVA